MTVQTCTIVSQSPEQTERIGHRLAGMMPAGTVAALRGELASGKTCLVRGMASRFAAGEIVSSPTFTLVNEYGLGPKLYHVDLYRLEDAAELFELGYEDLFEPDDGVSAVEWAERAEELLPARRVDVILEHVEEGVRKITIRDPGLLPAGWCATLACAAED